MLPRTSSSALIEPHCSYLWALVGTLFFPYTLRVKFSSVDVFTLCFSEQLPAASSARYFYKAHEMELFHHDYTHTSGLLGLVKATSCISTVSLIAGQKFLITSPKNHLCHSRATQKYNVSYLEFSTRYLFQEFLTCTQACS